MAESALRREKRRERAAYWAALTPAQRLRRATRLTRAARLLSAAGRGSLVREKEGPASPLHELGEVLALLKGLRIPHALIGGWAVVVSGPFRTSDDLDLLADFSPSQRKALLEAMSERYAAEWRAPGHDDPIAGLIRAKPRGAGLPVDILAAKGGADHEVLARARRVSVGGLLIPVARPEDLVAMKLEAGGGQDYVDAKNLLALPQLDEDVLLDACRRRRVLDRLALIRPR